MTRMQIFFVLGAKLCTQSPPLSLGYSSIAIGAGGGGVNAMFTFTIEGCVVVVVVNGRFVKEESPSLSFPLARRSSRCLLSREKSVASYRNAPLSTLGRRSRGRDRVYASWWR